MKELLLTFLSEMNFFDGDIKSSKEPSTPLQPGEKVLTELNEFERMCFGVMEMKGIEHENEHSEFGGSLDDIPAELQGKHLKLHTCMTLSKKLLLDSLQNRISRVDAPYGFQLRKGYKVVAYQPEKRPFFPGMFGVEFIEISM